jgi:hypothetical protein
MSARRRAQRLGRNAQAGYSGTPLPKKLGIQPGMRVGLHRAPVVLAPRVGRGGLWICWPKKASGIQTDVSDADVRAAGLASGLVDVKVCAVDATWSGLRFVRRKAR